jgi:periplasmic copper chaperone A
MKLPNASKIIAVCAVVYWPAASFSHVVLENKTAVTGSTYKAVFQVGHGCGGSPTTGLAVQIPPGFEAVKPHAKAGWTITTQGNTSVTWLASSKEAALPSAHFDEFVLRGKLPDAAGPLWFKVLQTCDDGVSKSSNNWTDVPLTGVLTKGLKSPAALLEVIAPGAPVAAMPAEHKH